MNIKRILMFMFLILGLVSGVNATIDDFVACYDFNTLDDATGNYDLTNSGTTNTTGITGSARLFTSGDYLATTVTTPINDPNQAWTHSYWIKTTSTTASMSTVNTMNEGTSLMYAGGLLNRPTEDKIQVWLKSANGAEARAEMSNAVNINNNGWHNIIIRHTLGGSANNIEIWIDGSNQAMTTITDTGTLSILINEKLVIGGSSVNDVSSGSYVGVMDDVIMYDRALTTGEIAQIYNGSTPGDICNIVIDPVLTFTNISANNITLINNTFYNDTINFETTILNTSTNGNINHTYSLNGASFTQFSTNSLTGSVDLNLSEGFYNISFQGINNETSVNSTNYSFIVDRSAPIINVIGNLTQNTFQVNFSTIFDVNYSISGEKSCSLNITYLTANESDSDFLIDCEDSQTFTRAGNYNGFLTAEDNAGNIVTGSVNGSINPVINIFFNQTNGSILLNYTATIFHPDGRQTSPTIQGDGSIQLSPINNGTIDLGLHTIQFSRLGFATENFTQLVNETNVGINVTFNVSNSVIAIRIIDRETNALLTGLTGITIQATTGFNGSTTTGLLNISNINFINEQYQILAEHIGYNTENVFFNYNNQEIINIDIFMLNNTAPTTGFIKLIVKNSLSQFVESAVCSALEWNPSESAFITVAQGLSNVDGETLLSIELNTKIYKFSCTKDTFTTVTNSQIIQVDESSLTIILNDVLLAPVPLFPNLVTSLTNTTLNSTHQLITYTFADADGLTTQACLKVYLVNGNRQNFNTENCVSSSTGELLLTVNTNQTSSILIQGTLTTPEVTNFVTDSLTFKGIGDIAGQFKLIGLDIILPTILLLLGLGLGILLSKIEIAVVFMLIAGWVSVAFVPTIMKSSIAMFISVIVGLMLWGGFNRK